MQYKYTETLTSTFNYTFTHFLIDFGWIRVGGESTWLVAVKNNRLQYL